MHQTLEQDENMHKIRRSTDFLRAVWKLLKPLLPHVARGEAAPSSCSDCCFSVLQEQVFF